MKKLILSILLLLISFVNFAQNSKVRFGVQAGINYTTLYDNESSRGSDEFRIQSSSFAYLGGFNLEYRFKEKWSLKLELNYERKSQKETMNLISVRPSNFDVVFPTAFETNINHDYLILPVMAKYNFSIENSFYVNGGLFIGYLLKSNSKSYEIVNNNSRIIEDIDITNSRNTFDFGLSFGLGKTFDLNAKNAIFVEIRENLGLIDTRKKNILGIGGEKTNALNLIVGCQFN